MPRMVHSKYGYEPPEWVQTDARIDKWYKDKKRRAKQHGAFRLDKNMEVQYESKRVRNNASHQRSLL
ncbi:hypothetical protein C4O30_16145 [Lactiplantibacillus plantarum]|nr:hypothetical protein C4O30_00260 [Lactiplantibacillus plantarum]AVE84436.1 hypothetical protein C4O30_16145 [Lactiplantibacillus plantarum]